MFVAVMINYILRQALHILSHALLRSSL